MGIVRCNSKDEKTNAIEEFSIHYALEDIISQN